MRRFYGSISIRDTVLADAILRRRQIRTCGDHLTPTVEAIGADMMPAMGFTRAGLDGEMGPVSASWERRASRLERVLRFCCTAMGYSFMVFD
jgi:hypothetical protein